MTEETSRPSQVDAKLLTTVEQAFAHHAGGDGAIDLADLQRALGLRSEYLTRRVMLLFDTNGDGVISKDEFVAGVRSLIFGTDREKLNFAFRLHDDNGDGFLDRQELLRMIAMSLAENDIAERATQPPEQLVSALLARADRDKDGRITFDDLAAFVLARPELLRKLTRNEAIWIAPNEELLVLLDERRGRGERPVTGRSSSVARWVILTLFFVANFALFGVSFLQAGRETPTPEILSRVGKALTAGITLDGALILVPMMRRLLTRIRGTWLGRLVPVDDAIDFHVVVGHVLFLSALAHGVAFGAAHTLGHAHGRFIGLLRTAHGPTGIALLGVFLVMWVFSLRVIRRGKAFELFYFTHLLYVAWFVLAVVHAPSFVLWAGVPIVGFLIEQIFRAARRAPPAGVAALEALRSGVTHLEIERPKGFSFRPGDYCFLCVPVIAKHEWHPFTISSAPERDRLGFHVRSLGDWTSALRSKAEASRPGDLVAYVDGPYGAPSGRIYDARFAVLIAAGIGVTPFASVLESLLYRANDPAKASKLEKAHFFWVNRDRYSFEWFGALLGEIERRDQQGLFDFHLCMTGGRTGMSAMGLEIAREIMNASGRSDIITGLRTHTHVGPPDWHGMLERIAKEHAGQRVEVFFCGPRALEAKLRKLSESPGMAFTAERF